MVLPGDAASPDEGYAAVEAEHKPGRLKKAIAIGLMDHATSEYKPMLRIGAAADGGLLVFFGDSLGPRVFKYGRLSWPNDSGLGITYTRVVHEGDQSLKLHYHRSGLVSISATGRHDSVRVTHAPLHQLCGAQLFTAVVSRPDLIASCRPKVGGHVFISYEPWPATVAIAGFLFHRSQLPDLSQAIGVAGSAVGQLQDHPADLLVDLAAYDMEAVLVLRRGNSPDPALRNHVEVPEAALYGFDSTAVRREGRLQCAVMWTTGARPNNPAVVPEADRPFSRRRLRFVTPDAATVTRMGRVPPGTRFRMPFAWTKTTGSR